jgi:hypothetical protein
VVFSTYNLQHSLVLTINITHSPKSRFLSDGSLASAVDIMNPTPGVYLDAPSYLTMNNAWSPFQNDKLETFLWGNLFSIACNLHALTDVLDRVSQQPSKMGPLQREFFEDTYAATQHAIVSFPRPNDAVIMQSATYFRQHSWRVAAMIYVNCTLRTWDIASFPIKTMVSELVLSLRQSDLNFMWSNFPEVLIWVLFTGASASWDKLDRGWLLLELSYGVKLFRLRSPEELETLLKSLLYCETMSREVLGQIWVEIDA